MPTTAITLPLSVSNAHLMLSDRPALVDAGSPGDVAALRTALARHRLRPEDLAVVVLTHGHTDHTGTPAVLAATVDTDLSLDGYGVDAHLRVVGGHTPGSCVVRAGADTMVGDLVRGGFAGGRIRPGRPLRHYFTVVCS